ncbi:unnamed protein product [Lactuca virosa]|uniref:Transcription factor CBF/NF-Y/archaeal histone domain-containing protein n=1 Tax=Lactuca virosa TaxID=75947 RepID=A0AAU9PPK3_9ASTR|nr:unnamed protein product [Lactuca virosa]
MHLIQRTPIYHILVPPPVDPDDSCHSRNTRARVAQWQKHTKPIVDTTCNEPSRAQIYEIFSLDRLGFWVWNGGRRSVEFRRELEWGSEPSVAFIERSGAGSGLVHASCDFITSEASDNCRKDERRSLTGDDLLEAMETLGFEDYVKPLEAYLEKYREIEVSKVFFVHNKLSYIVLL